MRDPIDESDAWLAHERHARYIDKCRYFLRRAIRFLSTVVTPLAVVFGIGLVGFFVIAESKTAFYVFLVYLPLAWLLILVVAAAKPVESHSVRALLNSFQYQVDRARQNLGRDTRSIDDAVQKAFDGMDQELRAQLQNKKIRMAQVKGEVLRFHDPEEPLGTRWRPPTLSEMGYVIAAADTFAPNTPLLALYKFSGEDRSRGNTVMDAYIILKEGSSDSFSGAFAAKVLSPFQIRLVIPEETIARLGAPHTQSRETSRSDTDHNVAYIMSMLGPIVPGNTRALQASLRAVSHVRPDTAHSEKLPAASVRGALRILLTEGISHDASLMQLTAAALRQAPQQFVIALASLAREDHDNPAGLQSALNTLAAILAPSAEPCRPELAAALKDYALTIQSLAAIPADHRINNPGFAYIEARGAEADSGFWSRIAQLAVAADSSEKVPLQTLLVTTTLNNDTFRERLKGYYDLQHGHKTQDDIALLWAGLDAEKITLNTVRDFPPVAVTDFVKAPSSSLVFTTDAGLVQLDGVASVARYLIWTPCGRLLDVSGEKLNRLQQQEARVRDILQQGAASQAQVQAGAL